MTLEERVIGVQLQDFLIKNKKIPVLVTMPRNAEEHYSPVCLRVQRVGNALFLFLVIMLITHLVMQLEPVRGTGTEIGMSRTPLKNHTAMEWNLQLQCTEKKEGQAAALKSSFLLGLGSMQMKCKGNVDIVLRLKAYSNSIVLKSKLK